MKFIVSNLFKAKKVPVGTRHKWHDGTYVKQGDHKWHKEKLTESAHAHLADNSKKKDPQIKKEFTAAVHDFADYLIKKDIHPDHIHPKDLHAFWSDAIGDKNYHKNAGWKKYVKVAVDAVKDYHGVLREKGFKRWDRDAYKKPKSAQASPENVAQDGLKKPRNGRMNVNFNKFREEMEARRKAKQNDEDEQERAKNYAVEHFLTQRSGSAKRKKALKDKTKKLAKEGKLPWQGDDTKMNAEEAMNFIASIIGSSK